VFLENSKRYFRVPVYLYQPGEIIEEDLYLLDSGHFCLFRPKSLLWKVEDEVNLDFAGVDELYIHCQSELFHHQFLENHLDRIIEEPKLCPKIKAEILYTTAQSLVSQIFVHPNAYENIRRSLSVIKHSINFLSRDEKNLMHMMALAKKDFLEYSHAIHVAAYAIRLAQVRGVRAFNHISALGIASVLHDVGKVKLDPKLLMKQGPLTDDDRKELERHVLYGYELVQESKMVPVEAEGLILQHHERPDGSGYPEGLIGSQMLSLAQILSLCDEYDSMIKDHPYCSGLSSDAAFELLKKRFDSDLVGDLRKIVGEWK